MLSYKTKTDILVQRTLGYIFFPVISGIIILLLVFYKKYKVRNLLNIRKKFKNLLVDKKPVLICPNHLTMIDSIILQWALTGYVNMLFHYNLFFWNIPAKENFFKSITVRLVTYLNKCIPIDRTGSKAHKDMIMEKIKYVLLKKDIFLMFPEGTRSRSGRIVVEDVTYGAGIIMEGVPDCRILCIYLRGDHQKTYSMLPEANETFTIAMEMISPVSSHQGLRYQRDVSRQVIAKLKELEDEYFGQNLSGQ